MAANGTADAIVSPRHAAATATTSADAPENEADGHDSQKKKSAFQITSVVVKSYVSEDDNQRHPRSMDELDLDADRNDGGAYASEHGLYEPFDNGTPLLLQSHDAAGGAALPHHPVAAALLSSSAVMRNFSHALDPKGSRFVVVKVESKDPYARGRWKCMDYQDESDKADASILVKSADSSGSSRASSVNYQHGVDDPLRNPLLGTLHNIPEGSATTTTTTAVGTVTAMTAAAAAAAAAAAKLSAVVEQQQALLAGVAAVPDGAHHLHHHHHGGSGSASSDPMLKTAFTGYQPPPPGVAALAPSASLVTAQALATASLSNGNLPGPPAAATAGSSLFSSAIPNARTTVEGLVGLAPSAGAGGQLPHEAYPVTMTTAAAVAGPVTAPADAETVVLDGRPSPSLSAGVALPAPQQLMQPKNPVVIVKPEPLRSTPVSAHLAMTLGETLGLQVRDEPSASDMQTRDTDATTTSVAIDNKIEQAMDLVKSHLMFAVREEVEDLRQQIKELVDEKNRLEYENTVLRAALSPEMLAKLLPPNAGPPTSTILKPSPTSSSS